MSLVGCKSIVVNGFLSANGIYDDKVEFQHTSFEGKDIVFFPMHHVGTENFYSHTKTAVDSLSDKGYHFYYEKVESKSTSDTLRRKIRKIIGIYSSNGYKKQLDSVFPNLKYKKPIVDQPAYELLGLNPANSTRADLDAEEIVQKFEEEHGAIKLADCDLKIPLNSNYEKCRKEDRFDKSVDVDKFLLGLRNAHVADVIQNSSYKKIVIIYGKEHIKGILDELKNK